MRETSFIELNSYLFYNNIHNNIHNIHNILFSLLFHIKLISGK